MIEIQFNRAKQSASSPAAPGVSVHNDTDPQFAMLRTLANMGHDGPWIATDEAGMSCWSGESIVKAARRYRPTDAEAADIAAKAKAARDAEKGKAR